MVVDNKEMERIIKTTELKTLRLWCNNIIRHLVDQGYQVEYENSDPFEYPKVVFVKKEVL